MVCIINSNDLFSNQTSFQALNQLHTTTYTTLNEFLCRVMTFSNTAYLHIILAPRSLLSAVMGSKQRSEYESCQIMPLFIAKSTLLNFQCEKQLSPPLPTPTSVTSFQATFTMGHFRVTLYLRFETSLPSKPLLRK